MNMIKKIISATLCAAMAMTTICSAKVSAKEYTGAYSTVNDGYYYISPKVDYTKCIDSEGGSSLYDGYNHNLHIWEYFGNDNQVFYIKYYDTINGVPYYTIRNKLTSYYMDVSGGNVYNHNNIWEYEFNGTDSQLFRFIRKGSYFVIMSKLSNSYALDLNCNDKTNGTNVQLYEYSAYNDAQMWKLNSYSTGSVTYNTVTLKDFSTIEEWEKSMMYAQMEAVGANNTYAPNANGEMVYYGKMIIGATVLDYKTITYTYGYTYGPTRKGDSPAQVVTKTIKLPSKIKFKLHKHERDQLVWFDFTNLTITEHCECGEWKQLQWEVPYPEEKKDYIMPPPAPDSAYVRPF